MPYNSFLWRELWSCINNENELQLWRISAAQRQEEIYTWSWFAIRYLLYFENLTSVLIPISTTLKSLLKEVPKKRYTQGMVSWVQNYFEILNFKLVWFDTKYKLITLHWYFNFMSKQFCLSNERDVLDIPRIFFTRLFELRFSNFLVCTVQIINPGTLSV